MSTAPPPSPPPDTEPSAETLREQELREVRREIEAAHEYAKYVLLGDQFRTPKVFPFPPPEDEKDRPREDE